MIFERNPFFLTRIAGSFAAFGVVQAALLLAQPTLAWSADAATPAAPATESMSEQSTCEKAVETNVRASSRTRLKHFCKNVTRLSVCTSTEGQPIQHSDFLSSDEGAKRVLVLGLIHGDEPLAAEMVLDWGDRLEKLSDEKKSFRNSWRIVPMLNPDGMKRHTRMNANGVDLNRNFPTKDWDESAQEFWKTDSNSDPRRFPGKEAASEAETKCVIAQIKDFKPDFIVSVHMPYHVLDFDGPKMNFPKYKDLPWRALGNFPGSLGRYMWRDYQTPVLTVELGQSMVDSAQLQDLVGSFAIEATRLSGRHTASVFDGL